MDSWSIALWVFAGYVAVVALMRLDGPQRNEVLAEFRGEVEKKRTAARPLPPGTKARAVKRRKM